MKRKKIDVHWLNRLRGTPVNTKIRICIDCGDAKISITEKTITCKNCGTTHKRKEFSNFEFQPGDRVRIADSDRGANLIYKIQKLRQDSDGVMHYILKSKSSPITLFYHENPESHLERA